MIYYNGKKYIPYFNGNEIGQLMFNGSVTYQKTVTPTPDSGSTDSGSTVFERIAPASYSLDRYLPYLNDAKTRILNNRKSMSNDTLEFIYITDIHWGKRKANGDVSDGNAMVSPFLIDWLRENVTGLENVPILFGGDAIREEFSTKQEAIDVINDMKKTYKDKMFTTLGNHDTNDKSQSYRLSSFTEKEKAFTNDEAYDLLLRQNLDFPNAHNITEILSSADKVDGDWFDDIEHKTRFFQFDYNIYASDTDKTKPQSNARAPYTINAILSNMPSSYRAIGIFHGWGSSGMPLDFLKGGYKESAYTSNIKNLKFVLGGHRHTRFFSGQTIQGHVIPIILRSADYGGGRGSNYYQDLENNGNYDAQFTIVQVDYDNNKVYLENVGFKNSGYSDVYDFYTETPKYDFSNMKFAVIGDSISTYTGLTVNYLNSYESGSTNKTNYAIFYGNTEETTASPDMNTPHNMWWNKMAVELGMTEHLESNDNSKICVCAYSGSKVAAYSSDYITSNSPNGACGVKRCTDVGTLGAPDAIGIFIGTNDFGSSNNNGSWTSAKTFNTTVVTVSGETQESIKDFKDSYAMMLLRLRDMYPKAKLLCGGITERADIEYDSKGYGISAATYNGVLTAYCNKATKYTSTEKKYVRKCNEMIQDVVNAVNKMSGESCYYVNTGEAYTFNETSAYTGSDYLHLNASGHDKVGKLFADKMREIFTV